MFLRNVVRLLYYREEIPSDIVYQTGTVRDEKTVNKNQGKGFNNKKGNGKGNNRNQKNDNKKDHGKLSSNPFDDLFASLKI